MTGAQQSHRKSDLCRLKRLAVFASRLRDPNAEFGSYRPPRGKGTPDDPLVLGWYELSELGEAFHFAVHEAEWIVKGFDWQAWSESDEARRLLGGGDAVRSATVAGLEKLLTLLVRRERFFDGTLDWAFENGLLRAIAERAEALAADASANG